MAEPMKLGLVGAGGIAQSYAQALRDSSQVRIAGVADVRSEAASALAEDLGTRVFETHEALAKDGDCEAVLVCTPPATHPEIALHFLGQGVPVLCEKPLAIDPVKAREVLEAGRRSGVLVTMASKFRYVEDVIRAKSLVASGIVGEVVLFENAFTARVDMSRRWNSDPAVAGGGVLIDNGTHSVDVIRYFFGPISEVSAMEARRIQGLPVEDTVRIFVRTASGVVGSVDLSWSVNKELSSFIDIYGSDGTVRVGWAESRYRQASSPDWVRFGDGYDKLEALRRQVENFCAAVRGEEALLIDAEDALASVEVIEAAYQSLRQDDWVPVVRTEDPSAAGT